MVPVVLDGEGFVGVTVVVICTVTIATDGEIEVGTLGELVDVNVVTDGLGDMVGTAFVDRAGAVATGVVGADVVVVGNTIVGIGTTVG